MTATTTKMIDHLKKLGQWDDLFLVSVEFCAICLDAAAGMEDRLIAERGRVEGMSNDDLASRWMARKVLADWLVIPEDRFPLIVLDHLGRDADLRRFLRS